MLAGVLVLGGDRDPAVGGLHVGAGLPPVQPAAVGVAAPHRVHLGQVGVGAPVARVDEREQPRAVRARLRAEDAGGGPPAVAVRRIRRRGRARAGSSRRRARRGRPPPATASSSSATTCGNASRKKPEMRSVTSMRGRPSSSSGHHLEAGDAPGRVVPGGPAAQQRERFRDVVALGAHRARAPDRQADRTRIGAGVGEVARDERVGQRGSDRPRVARRDRLRVHRVEVASGRQHVDQPAGGRPGRPGRHVAPVQRAQHVRHLVGGAGQARDDLGGGELQHPHDVAGRTPAGRPASPRRPAGPSRRASPRCPCRRRAGGPASRSGRGRRRRYGPGRARSRAARRAPPPARRGRPAAPSRRCRTQRRARRAARAGPPGRPRSGWRAARRARCRCAARRPVPSRARAGRRGSARP